MCIFLLISRLAGRSFDTGPEHVAHHSQLQPSLRMTPTSSVTCSTCFPLPGLNARLLMTSQVAACLGLARKQLRLATPQECQAVFGYVPGACGLACTGAWVSCTACCGSTCMCAVWERWKSLVTATAQKDSLSTTSTAGIKGGGSAEAKGRMSAPSHRPQACPIGCARPKLEFALKRRVWDELVRHHVLNQLVLSLVRSVVAQGFMTEF